MDAIRSTPETKKCPFCAELIQADALFCRFCGKDLRTPRRLMGWKQWLASIVIGFCLAFLPLTVNPALVLSPTALNDFIINGIFWSLGVALVVWIIRLIAARSAR